MANNIKFVSLYFKAYCQRWNKVSSMGNTLTASLARRPTPAQRRAAAAHQAPGGVGAQAHLAAAAEEGAR